MPLWQLSLTGTDGNRWLLRMCRQVTGRPKVMLFNWCYHGSVDEAFVTLDADGAVRSREGNVGPAVDPAQTTRLAEFNEIDSVEAALAHGDVACVLMEPALTNIGIVLPEPGFLEAVRAACTRAGDYEDTGGVGGTLAGNALSLSGARATLGEVLTDEAFARMSQLRECFVAGVEEALERRSVSWSIVSLGARAEYRFTPRAAAHRRRVGRRRRPGRGGVSASVPAEPRGVDHVRSTTWR